MGASNFHVDARQFITLVLVGNAPLSGFLVDDERPLVGVGNGEDGVAASGDIFAADDDVGAGDERGGCIGSSAPDFAEGNQAAVNFAAFGAGLE